MSVEDKRPAVMADVARLAGVSHQTVSRVLNDQPNVRPGTRERVLAAIAELAYRPNAAARTLVTRRTRMLGVISVETMLYGPTSMMYGFERAATAAHYFVSIASLPALDRRSMLNAVDRFVGQGAEGIIVIATHDSGVAALAHVPPEIPLVALGCGAHVATTSVAVDNATGAAAATAYLLDLGHRTVHLISGPPAYLDSDERAIGWRSALRAAGAPEPPVRAGDWSAASGYQAGLALARSPDVTAIFCGNDTMALGALRALSERGIRVPADVSIIGFDDIPEAAYYTPPLTTVRQDFGDVGRRALTALLERMSGEAPAGRSLTVETSLVIRHSAAPPPAHPPRPAHPTRPARPPRGGHK